MKIIFMGSGEFSIPALTKLHNSKHDLLAVYTKPAKQKNRGKQLSDNPVTIAAKTLKVNKIIIPKTFKDEHIVAELQTLQPDVIVVVSYGFILPDSVINAAKIMTINLHPSSLPRWRGAAPIERTIESGDTELDICVMKMVQKLDAGDIILRHTFELQKSDHASDIMHKIAEQGSDLILEALDKIEHQQYTLTPQTEDNLTYASKIDKSEMLVNWNEKAEVIYNKIRAFNASGGCYFELNGERVKILRAELKLFDSDNRNGSLDKEHKIIHCSSGAIVPVIIQKAGKKPSSGNDFFLGIK